MRNGKSRSVVGDPINFRGMAHAPTNEAGVVALFSMVARDMGMYIERIGTEYPDCIVRRDNGEAWEELAVEFEWDSRSFREHKHDPSQCDLVICWRDNWIDRPPELEVIQLSEEIKRLPNNPIVRLDRPY
jgi:hypothetical protein